MPTRVRSYSKINLGLAIGPNRPDGFHGLATLYQTLDLHDEVTVRARRLASGPSRIAITTDHPFVPADARNTAWKMIDRALDRLRVAVEVEIDIAKRLPVRGGLGAGSANAVAALIGLETELGMRLGPAERLELAAEIGSDVPLFLIGGLILGLGRGEDVYPMPDFPETHCVVAVPDIGVSTPQAFRDWDARQAENTSKPPNSEGFALTVIPGSDRLNRLSRVFASVLSEPHSSGVSSLGGSLAENPLLALVRTGIENDFEQVVFPQYPLLGDIKRILAVSDGPDCDPEQAAFYAALSGSGSAVFGLYATQAAAEAALERLKPIGVPGFRTKTLPRSEYWRTMVAGTGDQKLRS